MSSSLAIFAVFIFSTPFWVMKNILYYPEPAITDGLTNDSGNLLNKRNLEIKRTQIFGLRGFPLALAMIGIYLVIFLIGGIIVSLIQ